MSDRWRLAFWSAILGAFLLAGPVSAGPTDDTARVTDPAGDATGTPRDFRDVVAAEIAAGRAKNGKAVEEFVLRIELAGPVPDPTPPPTPGSLMAWGWELDVDPTLFPTITPDAAAVIYPTPWEFIAFASWDGRDFKGTLIDRRPEALGQPAILWEIPVWIEGTEIRAAVDSTLIDAPASFRWRAGAIDVYHFDNGFNIIDLTEVVPWPQP